MSGGGFQPYKKDAPTRAPGPVLNAMLLGRDLHGGLNAADYARNARRKTIPSTTARRRPPRPKRPPRPQRPPRI